MERNKFKSTHIMRSEKVRKSFNSNKILLSRAVGFIFTFLSQSLYKSKKLFVVKSRVYENSKKIIMKIVKLLENNYE